MTSAIFLDRDGVINKLAFFPDLGLIDSPLNPAQFILTPDAAEAIKLFNGLGLKVIVVSNQPAIAKGKMSEELFLEIRLKMKTLLEEKGAHVDGEYYCFHHPEAEKPELKAKCDCRKPSPGLILKAAKDFGLDLSECFMIGDGLTDIQAANAAGCKSILIGNLKCDLCRLMDTMAVKPDIIAPSLLEAYKIIENELNEKLKIYVDVANIEGIKENPPFLRAAAADPIPSDQASLAPLSTYVGVGTVSNNQPSQEDSSRSSTLTSITEKKEQKRSQIKTW
jgi:histidinol-phosphate phosphatase family protein